MNFPWDNELDNTFEVKRLDDGNSNPDSDFRFGTASSGYINNLTTRGLISGTWALNLSVGGDPLTHVLEFAVK